MTCEACVCAVPCVSVYCCISWTRKGLKASCVSNSITSLRELHSCYVSTYESGFLEGFRRWRGSILATHRSPDLQGSCSIPEHCSISDRSKQNSSKLRHTVWYPYMGHSANLMGSLRDTYMGCLASKG